MFTPQQLDEFSFEKAVFGGYDIQSVDEFLEPLIEDYVTLYKENALLKSKMRVLVEKLNEYQRNDSSIRDAVVNAQKTADRMVREAEAKCTKMLNDANATAAQSARNADSLIAAENARVEEARRVATDRINELQEQIQTCIQALERIKTANRPVNPTPAPAPAEAFDFEKPEGDSADAVADEISSSLEALVGTTEELSPKAEPRHPQSETTGKFTNLQFGRNYDPARR